MQFTELSELNKVVGMMRIAACNSPTFHDRQDSEVDRIYNSSPKMEMQLRNSWIDKMASFKPMAAANGSGTGAAKKTTAAPATSSAAAAAAAAAAANGAAKASANAPDTANRAGGKPSGDENDTRAGNKSDNAQDATNSDAKQRRMSAAPGKANGACERWRWL